MYLTSIELSGFKSFGKKTELRFGSPIAAIVGPNGSGKSNVAEAFRFVLGEQSMKSLRSRKGEDLIWGGSPALPRANRAAARVVFDNSSRLLDIDFPEVVVERVVYRDGLNEYLLNGTHVRLKDVIRLLAGANIGGSGYQIISQGEADRILNASPKERREMVEDALGLKLYQHKKIESERKLQETAQNIDKTKSLRREIAPHLNFLRMQVEKIEKAREIKEELRVQLHEYFAREDAWIRQEDARLKDEHASAQRELRAADEKLQSLPRASAQLGAGEAGGAEAALHAAQERALAARRARDDLSRELGRAEGALQAAQVTVEQLVPAPHVRRFAREVENAIREAESAGEMSAVRAALAALRGRITAFVEGLTGAAPVTSEETRAQVEKLGASMRAAEEAEACASADVETIRTSLSRAREAGFAAERERLEIENVRRDVARRVQSQEQAREAAAQAQRRFEEEVREAIALGISVARWQGEELPHGVLAEDRSVQEKRRRAIERLKIKIEESGIAGGDAVVREFKTTKERDEFLAKELLDLDASAASLKGIIADLENTIDERFAEGLGRINGALQNFFVKLFGGGAAQLAIEKARPRKERDELDEDDISDDEPDEAARAGLSVSVSLPRKKIHGLETLSGGERALTSIAMIFAMTQVNPPPFLILDETDAALDEANSRRYAEMIRELGGKSQLIVITHNRATMAAAGELFGVTMGQDGVSKLLSVKLEEAERVAK